jgi:hypothetical protein
VIGRVADGGSASVAPDSPAGGPWMRSPLLFVVARGQTRLLAELTAIFRDNPRVRVIEDRRGGQALLPRSKAVLKLRLPVC